MDINIIPRTHFHLIQFSNSRALSLLLLFGQQLYRVWNNNSDGFVRRLSLAFKNAHPIFHSRIISLSSKFDAVFGIFFTSVDSSCSCNILATRVYLPHYTHVAVLVFDSLTSIRVSFNDMQILVQESQRVTCCRICFYRQF